jgi:hypothetical protein
MTRVAGHGTIKPLTNPDATLSMICALPGCDRMVQPFGRGKNGVLIWRHVAPRRRFSGESKWITRSHCGVGYVDSGYGMEVRDGSPVPV